MAFHESERGHLCKNTWFLLGRVQLGLRMVWGKFPFVDLRDHSFSSKALLWPGWEISDVMKAIFPAGCGHFVSRDYLKMAAG